MLVDEARTLWTTCAKLLRDQVRDAVWQSTFADVEADGLEGTRLIVSVPNSRARDRLEGKFASLIRDALAEVGSPDVEAVVRVRAARGETEPAAAAPPPTLPLERFGTSAPEGPEAVPADGSAPPSRPLNDRYTFEAFVSGPSNRFAHAAALAVAERPSREFNPLFIYGDTGLGKTHLLMAVANYVREIYPEFQVRYVSCETFLNDYVDSIRSGAGPAFRHRYRDVDVLLVDDIQFIEGKEGFQEEFFHTFNDLYAKGGQIVLSSDRPPDRVATLEERLQSRFSMGLTTDIQPPDIETRLAILVKKAEREGFLIPRDVLQLIATHITDNIRELEGALNRVWAYTTLTGEELTLETAHRVLNDMLSGRQLQVITAALILEVAAENFGFTVAELRSKSRSRPLVNARQIAMYVCREQTDLSYPQIAKAFGKSDHTTVIHACSQIKKKMQERRSVYDQVEELRKAVQKRASGPAPRAQP